MKLTFASQNLHKLEEIRASLGHGFEVSSLASLGWTKEIPETEPSLEGNARLKARAVFNEYGRDCLADDTGLEIEALGGKPGVLTARFAGPGATAKENRAKTLLLLEGQEDRRATFRTVLVLVLNGQEFTFEGRVDGYISKEERGQDGFGYDSIFIPAGFNKTYAEMSLALRSEISHRARAIARLRNFLEIRQNQVSEAQT